VFFIVLELFASFSVFFFFKDGKAIVKFGNKLYTGEFVSGERHGYAVETVPVVGEDGKVIDDSVFRGYFHRGHRSQGKVTYPEGHRYRSYEGMFASFGGKDLRHGQGTLTFADGSMYTGTFVKGRFHVPFFFFFLVLSS
jgi:hypothetical protein